MQAREGDNPKKSSGCGERRQSGNVWRKENCLRGGEGEGEGTGRGHGARAEVPARSAVVLRCGAGAANTQLPGAPSPPAFQKHLRSFIKETQTQAWASPQTNSVRMSAEEAWALGLFLK